MSEDNSRARKAQVHGDSQLRHCRAVFALVALASPIGCSGETSTAMPAAVNPIGTESGAAGGAQGPAPEPNPAPTTPEPAPSAPTADPAGAGGQSEGTGGAASTPAAGGAAAGGAPPVVPANSFDCANHADALYCDNFELGITAPFSVSAAKGSVFETSSLRAHSGAHSVYVRSTTPQYSDAWLTLKAPVFPTADNSFYMRSYVYYAGPGSADNVYLFQIRGDLADGKGTAFVKMGAEGNPYNKPDDPNFKKVSTLIYHSQVRSADHKVLRAVDAPVVVYGEWTCWEWHVDGVNHQWTMWVDGAQHLQEKWNQNPADPWQTFSTREFQMGVQHPHDQPGEIELWFDDLVISSARVGCGTPPN